MVVLETKVHIFDMHTMRTLHTLDTCPNPLGLCAVSAAPDACLLAVPASVVRGEVIIYDAVNLQV